MQGIHESFFAARSRRRRLSRRVFHLFPDVPGGGGGGPASTPSPAPAADVPPVNGGPDRSYESLANSTLDGGNAGPGGVGPAGGGGVQGQGGGTGTPQGAQRTPTDPNQAAGATQTPAGQQPAPQWLGIRAAAEQRGFRFGGDVQNDEQALAHLLAVAQRSTQADMYARLGQQVAPMAQDFQQFMQQRGPQGQGQTQQPPQRQEWEAPPFDPNWEVMCDRDPQTGLFYAKQGVPQHIATQLNDYAKWMQKFQQNPTAMIRQAAQAEARNIGREQFQQLYAEQQQQQEVASIMAENSRFLFQVDGAGRQMRDYGNRPILTPVGQLYVQQLQRVTQFGVTNPRQADQMAKDLVRSIHYQAHYQQQAAAQQQQNPEFQQQQSPGANINQGQANPQLQRQQTLGNTDPDQSGIPLHERMMAALKQHGVTDDDVARSVGTID